MVQLVLNIQSQKLFRCATALCMQSLATCNKVLQIIRPWWFFSALWSITWCVCQPQQWTVSIFSTSPQLRSNIFPFVPVCSLPPETAPVISAPRWEMHGNKEKLGAQEGWLCFPNHTTTFLLFLCDLHMLCEAQVSRMTGSSLLREIEISNKYSIMKITQGKKEALGANAANCCLPACFNPSRLWKSNGRRAAAQKPHVPWEPSTPRVGGGPAAGGGSCPSTSLRTSPLRTNVAFPSSSPPWQGGFLVGCNIASRLPSRWGREGRGWDLGFPGRDGALAGLGVVGSHSSTPLSVRQSPAVPSAASQSLPALSNCFMRSHRNPQVNSDFLFIRFSWKTKQLFKKSKTQDLNVIYAPNYLILVGILVAVWSEH